MTNHAATHQDIARLIAQYVDGPVTSSEDLNRMSFALDLIPKAAAPGLRLIDVGGTIHWLPLYLDLLGYQSVSFINRSEYVFPKLLKKDAATLAGRFEIIDCDIDLEPFALPDESASLVVCFEVLEHLPGDPMNMIAEVGGILQDGGTFILSTPNVLNKMNALRFLFGAHPFSWSAYTCRYADRHNREFTPGEVDCLLRSGGFSVEKLLTISPPATGTGLGRLAGWLLCLAPAVTGHVPLRLRNQHLFACATKRGPVKDRYPSALYNMYGFDHVMLPKRRTTF